MIADPQDWNNKVIRKEDWKTRKIGGFEQEFRGGLEVFVVIGRTKIAPYFHICNSKNTIPEKNKPRFMAGAWGILS
jgi:hypothetical protein